MENYRAFFFEWRGYKNYLTSLFVFNWYKSNGIFEIKHKEVMEYTRKFQNYM